MQLIRESREGSRADPRDDESEKPACGHKFMQTVGNIIYSELERIADQKGVTVQGLIRAVIIPEWIGDHNQVQPTLSGSIIPETTYREKPENPPHIGHTLPSKSISTAYKR